MGTLLDTELSSSVIASIVYSSISLAFFLGVCAFGWQKLKEKEDAEREAKDKKRKAAITTELVTVSKRKRVTRLAQWLKLVWKMKSIYLSALVHIYDIATVRTSCRTTTSHDCAHVSGRGHHGGVA